MAPTPTESAGLRMRGGAAAKPETKSGAGGDAGSHARPRPARSALPRSCCRCCCLLLGSALAPVLYVLRCSFMAPALAPPEFLELQRRGAETRPALVCIGDSITQGTHGLNWVEAIRGKFPQWAVVNAGVNGQTSWSMARRLGRDVLALRPDALVVFAGINDAIGLFTGSWLFAAMGEAPAPGLSRELFRENMQALLGRPRDAGVRHLAVMTIPMLDEVRGTGANVVVDELNAILREVAATTGARVLDLNGALWSALDQWGASGGRGRSKLFDGLDRRFVAAPVLHYIFGWGWDAIGEWFGQHLFTGDNIHINDRGGRIAVDLVASWLREVRP